MSAQAIKGLHLAPVLDSSFSKLAGAIGRLPGDGQAEPEPSKDGLLSGRPQVKVDRDNLEPHWVAAIETATD
jgi:hypothetical protein